MAQISQIFRLRSSLFYTLTIAAFLLLSALPVKSQIQISDYRIVINGKPLTGIYVVPQKKNNQIFLPAAAIALSLGDELKIDSSKGTVFLRRQNGLTAEFDTGNNQVKENGAVVLSLSSADRMTLPPYEEFLTLPVEIVIAFFDVSVQIDSTKQEIRIRRELQTERQITSTEKKQKPIEVFQADYDYRMDKFRSTINHNLVLNMNGRVGESRFNLLLNNSTGNSRNPFWQPQSGTLTVARPNGQQFAAGDFSSSRNLLFLQTPVRGASFSAPLSGGRVSVFGGKSFTSWFDRIFDGVPGRIADENRDAYLVGGTMNFDESASGSQSGKTRETSAGAMVFGNKNFGTGVLLTGNSHFTTKNSLLRVNLAASGYDDRRTADDEDDSELGFAADFSGNYRISREFTVQGRFLKVSRDFQSARKFQNFPQTTFGGGASWRPLSWLSGSVNANFTRRTDLPSAFTRSVFTSLNIAPRNRALPNVYISHLETGSNLFRSGKITNVNVTKDFVKWQLFSDFTRAKIIGAASTNMQFGARIRGIGGGFLQASQFFGSSGTLGGNFDWNTGESYWNRLNFSTGVGYYRDNEGSISLTGRGSTSISLPRRNTLQFSYFNTSEGHQITLSLRGSLLPAKAAYDYALTPNRKIEKLSTISGRVFQDINENGSYEPEIDKPQTNVRLRMENGQSAVTDEFGLYTFDDLSENQYKVSLDPLTVRADLTILDGEEVSVMLPPGRTTQIDFRLVRTGQVSGTIWLDENDNGIFDKNEKPLADIRLLAGNGKDTLTDAEGSFSMGDLPPGEYALFIDEKTLPANTKPTTESTTVKIIAGQRVSDFLLPVKIKPAITKNF